MPLPEIFDVIRSDPEWREFSPREQTQVRAKWVQRRLISSTNPNDPKLKAQLVEDAYRDAPEWLKPIQPVSEGRAAWEGVKGTAGEIGGRLWDAGMRTLRTPQQLIANLLEQTMSGITGYEKPKSPLEAFVRPFKRTAETAMGRREPTKLAEGEFLEPLSETITDPLMYVGVGLAPRVRDISRLAKLRKAGVTRPIPPLYGRAAREAGEAASVLKPGAMAEIEAIPRGWATMTPQQQGIYKQVMQAGRANITKDQLQRVAETVANASPEEAQSVIEALASGNKNKIRSVITRTETPGWKRTPLKGGRVKPPTATEVPIAEELNRPGGLAEAMEKMGGGY